MDRTEVLLVTRVHTDDSINRDMARSHVDPVKRVQLQLIEHDPVVHRLREIRPEFQYAGPGTYKNRVWCGKD